MLALLFAYPSTQPISWASFTRLAFVYNANKRGPMRHHELINPILTNALLNPLHPQPLLNFASSNIEIITGPFGTGSLCTSSPVVRQQWWSNYVICSLNRITITNYRVALHYRDLPVTTNEFLTDCIIETANASRRVIMVVSENLLRT